MTMPVDDSTPQWFAMRVTYGRELMAQRLLDDAGIESFIPMHYVIEKVRNKSRRMLKPAIHNLLFIHAAKGDVQRFKARLPYLQYMTFRENGHNVPIVVKDKEMSQFIDVTQNSGLNCVYFKPEELNLARGARVRIHGGPLDGKEGIFIKVKGRRSKSVVLAISNVIAVAFAQVSPDYLEVIDDAQH